MEEGADIVRVGLDLVKEGVQLVLASPQSVTTKSVDSQHGPCSNHNLLTMQVLTLTVFVGR